MDTPEIGASGTPQEIDPRIVLAAEQNLLAWIRTGLSLMGFGFVVARFGLFLRELAAGQHHGVSFSSTGFPLVVGATLVGLGVAVNIVAARQHLAFVARLNRREKTFSASASIATLLAVALAALGVGITVYLFLTER